MDEQSPTVSAFAVQLADGTPEELLRLKQKIQERLGFNSDVYKDKCLRRRIAVRMRARGQRNYGAYADLLEREPREFELLMDALTINVTKFFRNPETWSIVEQEVVPALFEARRPLTRIWSAGCSSGEEPYTFAILLHACAERDGRLAELRRFAIEATDIDRQSLAAAKRGEYPELALLDAPAAVRERWFSAAPPYRLNEEVKRRVAFRRHDLISEPAPSGCSVIICRNVIIYLERTVQERIFRSFYDALLPGGYLVLGKVETLLGAERARFRVVHARERIFRKPL